MYFVFLYLEENLWLTLDSILKSRDITLPEAMVFPVVMYECESWTIKKAEHRRIDAFEMWWWWRLLRVPWTAWRSNQSMLKKSILNIHWKDWCWRWNSDTLATWCEELIHLKRPWYWERLKTGGEGDSRGWNGWIATSMRWSRVWLGFRSWWWTGKPGALQSMGSQSQIAVWLNWTVLGWIFFWITHCVFFFFLDLLIVVIRLISSPAGLGAQWSRGYCLTNLSSIMSFTKTFTVRQQYFHCIFKPAFQSFIFELFVKYARKNHYTSLFFIYYFKRILKFLNFFHKTI